MTFDDLQQSITMLLLLLAGARMVAVDGDRARPGRIATGAFILFALVLVPTVAQAFDHSVYTSLARRPHEITAHHEYWRLFTSELVQDGGVEGAVYNLVTLAVVATFAGWFWGGARSIAIFFVLGVAFDIVNVLSHQAGGGNSGATYGLAATLAGYGLLRAPLPQLRALCAVAVLGGPVIWALGNIHGYAILAGGVLGIVFALAGLQPTLRDWRERILGEPPAPAGDAGVTECAAGAVASR